MSFLDSIYFWMAKSVADIFWILIFIGVFVALYLVVAAIETAGKAMERFRSNKVDKE